MLRSLANQKTGIVISDDKFDMFYSRLSRRVRLLGMRSFREYCDLLKKDPTHKETTEFVNAITTNLTSFFREMHHFSYLKDVVIPELLTKNKAEKKIRIWSAGCSTGEEPYSIAMTVNEAMAGERGWDVRILATDIDSNVLEKASQGVYPMERISGIPKATLKRHFMKGKGKNAGFVRLKPEIRSRVSFGQLNLMENWSMDEQLDIIFCRNVIIYFDKETKARLVDRYADNLRQKGYLFIGHSESLYQATTRFRLIGNTIYQKES